jgi:hypothetical protein
MSKRELVDAYLSGEVNRRLFVRGLVALGVPATTAAAYAVALQPASASHRDDFYGHPSSKAKCRNGGFARYGFKNQRRCVAYVNRSDDRGGGNR